MPFPSRHWFYKTLNDDSKSKASSWINNGLLLLIVFNVIAVVLESEIELHQRYHPAFFLFEAISVILFTLEYLLRVWSSVEVDKAHMVKPLKTRLAYMLTPMAILDLLTIVPFYLGFFFGIQDLRILRSLRLLRILKLTRYSQSMELLTKVIAQEAETMVSALFLLCILILLSATGIYLVEGHVQPEAFGSIPRSLWWAVVTLTTVGYGDIVPHTLSGRTFSGVITVTGIAVAALPAAILASGLINELDRRRETFRTEVLFAMEDGKIDLTELRHLEAMRNRIGLTRADARLIMREVKQAARLQTHLNCPHCQNPLIIGHPAGYVHVKATERPYRAKPAAAPPPE